MIRTRGTGHIELNEGTTVPPVCPPAETLPAPTYGCNPSSPVTLNPHVQ